MYVVCVISGSPPTTTRLPSGDSQQQEDDERTCKLTSIIKLAVHYPLTYENRLWPSAFIFARKNFATNKDKLKTGKLNEKHTAGLFQYT